MNSSFKSLAVLMLITLIGLGNAMAISKDQANSLRGLLKFDTKISAYCDSNETTDENGSMIFSIDTNRKAFAFQGNGITYFDLKTSKIAKALPNLSQPRYLKIISDETRNDEREQNGFSNTYHELIISFDVNQNITAVRRTSYTDGFAESTYCSPK